jgi:RhoGAP domain
MADQKIKELRERIVVLEQENGELKARVAELERQSAEETERKRERLRMGRSLSSKANVRAEMTTFKVRERKKRVAMKQLGALDLGSMLLTNWTKESRASTGDLVGLFLQMAAADNAEEARGSIALLALYNFIVLEDRRKRLISLSTSSGSAGQNESDGDERHGSRSPRRHLKSKTLGGSRRRSKSPRARGGVPGALKSPRSINMDEIASTDMWKIDRKAIANALRKGQCDTGGGGGSASESSGASGGGSGGNLSVSQAMSSSSSSSSSSSPPPPAGSSKSKSLSHAAGKRFFNTLSRDSGGSGASSSGNGSGGDVYDENNNYFGQSLLYVQGFECRASNFCVPYLVQALAKSIMQTGGMTSQGIFRVSGSSALVNGFVAELGAVSQPTSTKPLERVLASSTCHTSAALLKRWFQALPMPLIDHYDAIKHAESPRDLIDELETHLSANNFDMLRYLITFLRHVAQHHADKTKMNSANLAMTFAPVLFRNPSNDPLVTLRNAAIENSAIEALIDASDFLIDHSTFFAYCCVPI